MLLDWNFSSSSAEADRYVAKGKSKEAVYSTGPKISKRGKGRALAGFLTTEQQMSNFISLH